MGGLDDQLANLAAGGGLVLALAIALLLGLRHATDPDHLTAVSTLALADERRGARRAAVLGFSWGAGHAATLTLIGLPLVLFDRALPDAVQRGLELAVGVVVFALALRLLVRWRRGYLHAHVHDHDGERHAHAHVHVHEHVPRTPHPARHAHAHAASLGRTPRAAFAIGLLHGAGGSAGAAVLLVAAMPGRTEAAVALAVFAAATALSMGLVSTAFGYALGRRGMAPRLEAIVPVFGVLALLFGAWYALGALDTVPYVL